MSLFLFNPFSSHLAEQVGERQDARADGKHEIGYIRQACNINSRTTGLPVLWEDKKARFFRAIIKKRNDWRGIFRKRAFHLFIFAVNSYTLIMHNIVRLRLRLAAKKKLIIVEFKLVHIPCKRRNYLRKKFFWNIFCGSI